MGIKKARVSTCSHPFFVPAQRLYVSCGFIEINRKPWDLESSKYIIEYEMKIEYQAARLRRAKKRRVSRVLARKRHDKSRD